MLVIVDRLRENRSLARLTLASTMICFIPLALATHFGWVRTLRCTRIR